MSECRLRILTKACRAIHIAAATLALITSALWAPFAFAQRDYTDHSGYLVSTEGERDRRTSDMIIIQPPASDGPTLQQYIFNEKLSKEFSDRYEEKFGRTEVERVYNSPNRYTYYDDMYGFKGTPEQANQERRDFADFMIRRLAEYHVDNFTKSNPRARVIWEAKERLSNVNVQVQQFRFDVNYEIAGNTFDMKIANPYLTMARVRIQMNPSALGPGPVDEATISLGRPVTKSLSLETHFKTQDGVISYIARQAITPRLGGTLTVSTFLKQSGVTNRESLYLSGFSYVF